MSLLLSDFQKNPHSPVSIYMQSFRTGKRPAYRQDLSWLFQLEFTWNYYAQYRLWSPTSSFAHKENVSVKNRINIPQSQRLYFRRKTQPRFTRNRVKQPNSKQAQKQPFYHTISTKQLIFEQKGSENSGCRRSGMVLGSRGNRVPEIIM